MPKVKTVAVPVLPAREIHLDCLHTPDSQQAAGATIVAEAETLCDNWRDITTLDRVVEAKPMAVCLPSKNQIAEYWITRVDECDLGADCDQLKDHCWRCGEHERRVRDESNIDRCHIVPRSRGGSDGVENLVLLCKYCHSQAPDIADPHVMWDWIKRTRPTYTGLDQLLMKEGEKEYRNLFGSTMDQDFENQAFTEKQRLAFFATLIRFVTSGTSTHAGIVKPTTRAYVFRVSLEKAKAYAVEKSQVELENEIDELKSELKSASSGRRWFLWNELL